MTMDKEKHHAILRANGATKCLCGADLRLPYEPPRVVSSEVFETLALSCPSSNPMVCAAMPLS